MGRTMTVLRPDRDQLMIAAEFLQSYDGDPNPNDPAERACHATAKWLLSLIEKADQESAVRRIRRLYPELSRDQATKVYQQRQAGKPDEQA
jgi:hypothetical protein